MTNSKLGSCRIKFGLSCHAKVLVNTCWPRIQKITLKVKSSSKNVLFWRCGQNDGGYLEYRSSEHFTLFKTLLRDVFSSERIHIIISLEFMKKEVFENLTFFTFSVIFTYDFMHIFLLNHFKNLSPEKLKYLKNDERYEKNENKVL